ncbi:MAG: hypothetical protein Q8Q91_02615 [Candidatus Daviesbacteria bacterium]|nr:hypothetical protein [Candidatus Daviesbacteria bacterium]
MEKAILKTLVYADIFDYPLKINEIHKWLIGKKATLRQIEKALKGYQEYYFLGKRDSLVSQRLRKKKQSAIYLRKAKILSQVLKIIPWIKLVGISGGLALNNAGKSDDIDLFIITGKNRLWMSRLLILGLLSLAGQRRKKMDSKRKIAGKLCVNILLEEDKLEQSNKDIFIAHEVLQMRVLWQRDGIYSKYLSDNSWAFKFLPNWLGNGTKNSHNTKYIIHNTFFDMFEKLAKKLQFMIMKSPEGMERIEDGALYFHPQDCRLKILQEYKKRLAKIISP